MIAYNFTLDRAAARSAGSRRTEGRAMRYVIRSNREMRLVIVSRDADADELADFARVCVLPGCIQALDAGREIARDLGFRLALHVEPRAADDGRDGAVRL